LIGRVDAVGVVGAGTMGSGIAAMACLGGYPTRIHDPDPEALGRAQETASTALAKGAGKAWSEADAERAGGLLSTVAGIDGLEGCDLVIEAAPERLDLKQGLFAELAAACGPEAILASNTSSLRVADIAARTPGPERVVGMHFFNPPTRMRLVEVVATDDSSAAALEAATEAVERMRRTPIRAKDSPGFIANRLARPFSLESLRMLGDGVADAATIDRVCRLGGGFRMGPFELIDLIGLDVNLSVARSFYEQGGRPERWRPSPIQAEMVAAGRLGRKSGEGFYRYGDGRHRPDDPDLGIEAPTLDPGELTRIDPAASKILPRLFAQIANETAFAREEEVGTPADMDTAMRLGFNWPLGPVEITRLIGPGAALSLLERLREEHGDAYIPAPSLAAAAEG
jgi:3-hydroxybutyryl-CoA dehydrogenase